MDPESTRTGDLRLRAAVESSPSGLLMIDSEGRIVLVNHEIERLFQYPREELLGRTVEMLVPERFRGHHPTFRAGFAADPKIRSMGAGRELFGLRKDGSEVPIEIGLTPVATAEGLFVISSIVDISSRKQAEARFRIAVESSPNGMVMVDSIGKIILVNREVERLFGYSRDELLGQPIEMLVPVRFRDKHPDYRAKFNSEPQQRSMGVGRELFGKHKDGSEIPVEIGLNPIQTDDGLLILSSIVDISARREAEKQHAQLQEKLRQAQKMEAIGRLAGGIAHDFNNILSAIFGYAEFAQEKAAEPQVREDIEQVLCAARRARELVERILAFSRRHDATPERIDLASTVGEATRLLRATLPAGIEIQVNLEKELPQVLADGTSIHQVLMNLATNSAHAMPSGGKLNIDLTPFYVRDSFARAHPNLREGYYAMMSITDTGEGMSSEALSRAFEPFFTTKAPGKGTGLGLSMVHGVIHELGGTVWIESNPGKGTKVSCLIPAIDAETDVQVEEEVKPLTGQGECILYVDDETSIVDVSRRRLESLGYRIIGMNSPVEALRQFEMAPYDIDLVITDFSMPQMSGVELASRISAQRPGLPIILVTGFMEDFGSDQIAGSGVKTVLKKPLTAAQIAEVVHTTLKSRK